MVQAKVVSIKELLEDNPTFCLSPYRVFELCHKCEAYKRAKRANRLDKMRCKPRVKPIIKTLEQQKHKLLSQLAEINKKLKRCKSSV